MKQLLFSGIALLLFTGLSAQHSTLNGKVIDASGDPVYQANVYLSGFVSTAITDLEGRFTLKGIKTGSYTLTVSSIGYEMSEQTIAFPRPADSTLSVELEPALYDLVGVDILAQNLSNNERVFQTISRLPVKQRYQAPSMTVLTEDLLQQQQLTDLADVVNLAPGFNLESTRGNRFPKIQARGANATLLVNGLRLESNTRGGDGIFAFNTIDNLQFVNGSTSIGLGNASIGGAVNIKTKQASFRQGGYLFTSAGSFGRTFTGFDKQWVVNDRIGVRLNGSWNRGETFREGTDYSAYSLAPSLAYKLNERSEIRLDYIYQYDDRTPDVGQLRIDSALLATEGVTIEEVFRPSDQQSIREDFVGFNQDYQRQTTHSVFLGYSYSFSDKLKFNVNAGLYDKGRNIRNINTRRAYRDTDRDRVNDVFERSAVYQENGATSYAARADVLGQRLRTGAFTHHLQVSADIWHNANDVLGNGSDSRDPGPVVDQISLLNPTFTNDVQSLTPEQQDAYYTKLLNTQNDAQRTIYGLTMQDQLVFAERLRMTLGLRYSWGSSQSSLTEFAGTDTTRTNSSDRVTFDGFTPSLAVFYDVTEAVTLFGSYSNTFDETSISPTRVDINGELIGNEVIDQLEAGLRTSLFSGMLTANLTFYQIFNNNKAVQAVDIDNEPIASEAAISEVNPEGNYFVRLEEERRRGIELSVQGQLTPDLMVLAGYAYYNFARKLPTDTEAIVQTTDYNPAHSGNLLVRYQPQKGRLAGLFLSGGVEFVGDRTATARGRNGFTFTNEAYTVLTAAAGYTWNDFQLSTKWNNLGNTLAYNTFGTTFINPITPFNFDVRLTYSF